MFTGTTPPEVRNLLNEVKTKLNIKSNSVAFLKMINICKDHIDNMIEEE